MTHRPEEFEDMVAPMTLEEVIDQSIRDSASEGMGADPTKIAQAIRKWLIRTGILYKDNGRYYIGMHGDADVTDKIMGGLTNDD